MRVKIVTLAIAASLLLTGCGGTSHKNQHCVASHTTEKHKKVKNKLTKRMEDKVTRKTVCTSWANN